MPRYHKLGNIPHKRHTVFKKNDGSIHYEQLFGTIGFDGMSSLLYHLHPPTMVNEIHDQKSVAPEIAVGVRFEHAANDLRSWYSRILDRRPTIMPFSSLLVGISCI